MKLRCKIAISLFLAIALLFLSSCSKMPTNSSEQITANSLTLSENESYLENSSDETSNDTDSQASSSVSAPTISNKSTETDKKTSSDKKTGNTGKTGTNEEDIDIDIDKDRYAQPEGKKLTELFENSYDRKLLGKLVDWVTLDNKVYVITENWDFLYVFDTDKSKPVSSYPLPSKPKEIRFFDNKLYIFLPQTAKINVYNSESIEQISSMSIVEDVSSFCIGNNVIYYGKPDGSVIGIKTIIKNDGSFTRTRETVMTGLRNPKLEINEKDRLLYIGESEVSGARLFYVSLDDNSVKSSYTANGNSNGLCNLFFTNGYVYWGDLKLSPTNANSIIKRYHSKTNGSMTFVNDKMVCTSEGVFDEKTAELKFGFANCSALDSKTPTIVTKDNTVMLFVATFNGGGKEEINTVVCFPFKY